MEVKEEVEECATMAFNCIGKKYDYSSVEGESRSREGRESTTAHTVSASKRGSLTFIGIGEEDMRRERRLKRRRFSQSQSPLHRHQIGGSTSCP